MQVTALRWGRIKSGGRLEPPRGLAEGREGAENSSVAGSGPPRVTHVWNDPHFRVGVIAVGVVALSIATFLPAAGIVGLGLSIYGTATCCVVGCPSGAVPIPFFTVSLSSS